jgi:hypothetical protein
MNHMIKFGFLLPFFFTASAWAAGGACPAGTPLSGQNACYFVAANGADSNSGTSESSPWLHAPGMPSCTGNCAALSAGNGGIGIILRGGDTWHEGNSSASPYTGGTWDLFGWFSNAYGSSISNCVYEGAQSGCLYVGVDTTWYSGSAWARPIITGDNPTTGLTPGSFVSSCAYQIANPGGNWGTNNLINVPAYTIIDNFELTGLCSSAAGGYEAGNTYFAGWAAGTANGQMSFLTNTYSHGWSATSTAGGGSSHPLTVFGGGGGVLQVFDHNVIDGSDSNPEEAAWAYVPWFYHVRDNMIRYVGDGTGAQCHDIHDNIFEHFYTMLYDGHYNMMECNHDAAPGTSNVIYNNIVRHFDPSFGNGEVFWVCPNTTPEFWFNNLMYDVLQSGQGQWWAYAGASQYPDCTNTGGQYMFNNTFVDGSQTCDPHGSTLSGGKYLTVYNEHLINTPWDTTSSDPNACSGINDPSNVSMTDATATSQGYTTGSSGTVSSNTCANDSSKPCMPTSSGNSTVGAGRNEVAYCNTLGSYGSETAIGTDAANACKYGTTDGCAYNSTTHTMSCPAQTALARPGGKAWDSGAYQYAPGPSSPNSLQATPVPINQ